MNLAADMGRHSGRATPSLHDDPYRQIEEATGRRSTYPLPILVQTNRATSQPAAAEAFKSVSQCVPGTRVSDNSGHRGTIVRVSQGTLCVVRLDVPGPTGPEQSSIFWMLHAEGGSAETNDRLVAGRYACYAGNPNNYTFMDLRITGAGSYQWAGQAGALRVEPSRRITFLSGPLRGYTSKLLAGPSVGLNTDGG